MQVKLLTRFNCLSLLLLIELVSLAQGASWKLVDRAEALEISVQWSKVNGEREFIKADFEQKQHFDYLDDALISKGLFYFKSPDMIRWEFVQPEEEIMIFKGKEGRVIKNGSSRRLRGMSRLSDINITMDRAIKGKWDELDDFSWSLWKSKSQYKLELLPKDNRLKQYISSITMILDQKSYWLDQLILNGKDGDVTQINFSGQQQLKELGDHYFNWE